MTILKKLKRTCKSCKEKTNAELFYSGPGKLPGNKKAVCRVCFFWPWEEGDWADYKENLRRERAKNNSRYIL